MRPACNDGAFKLQSKCNVSFAAPDAANSIDKTCPTSRGFQDSFIFVAKIWHKFDTLYELIMEEGQI